MLGMKSLDHGGVVGRHVPGKDLRSSRGFHPPRGHIVLHRQGDPLQRAVVLAGSKRSVGSFGCRPGFALIESQVGMQVRFTDCGSGYGGVDQITSTEVSVAEPGACGFDREIG